MNTQEQEREREWVRFSRQEREKEDFISLSLYYTYNDIYMDLGEIYEWDGNRLHQNSNMLCSHLPNVLNGHLRLYYLIPSCLRTKLSISIVCSIVWCDLLKYLLLFSSSFQYSPSSLTIWMDRAWKPWRTPSLKNLVCKIQWKKTYQGKRVEPSWLRGLWPRDVYESKLGKNGLTQLCTCGFGEDVC